MTDDEVKALYASQRHNAFSMSEKCSRCRDTWGNHNGAKCPQGGTTFLPSPSGMMLRNTSVVSATTTTNTPIDYTKVKVEVGQVWVEDNFPTNRHQISRVGVDHDGDPYCWSKRIQEDGSLREEETFGSLRKDCTPCGWGSRWHLETTVTTQSTTMSPATAQDDPSAELRFFRTSSHSGQCPCGGSYGVCPYHP